GNGEILNCRADDRGLLLHDHRVLGAMRLNHRRRIRSGLTLFEVLISVALLLVLAAVIMPSVASSRVAGDTERIDHVVLVLEQLRDAIARFNMGSRGDTSYTWRISGIATRGGTYPSKLSMLTTKIVSTVP